MLLTTLKALINAGPVEIPEEIPLRTFEGAKSLYHTSHKMKLAFTQAVSTLVGQVLMPVRQVEGIQAKVVKAITRCKGPMVSVRNLQKKMKNVNTEILKVELLHLQNEGFGYLHEGHRNSTFFFKPHPDSLAETTEILKIHGILFTDYCLNFRMLSQVTSADRTIILNSHPQADLLMDLFSDTSSSSDDC